MSFETKQSPNSDWEYSSHVPRLPARELFPQPTHFAKITTWETKPDPIPFLFWLSKKNTLFFFSLCLVGDWEEQGGPGSLFRTVVIRGECFAAFPTLLDVLNAHQPYLLKSQWLTSIEKAIICHTLIRGEFSAPECSVAPGQQAVGGNVGLSAKGKSRVQIAERAHLRAGLRHVSESSGLRNPNWSSGWNQERAVV